MTIALLTAAGVGSRMGQVVPKQFLNVEDKPILIYTMERFQKNPQIDAICVVTLPNWVEFVKAYSKQFGVEKLRWIVSGGESGQESIRNGINALAQECPEDTVVMIHDGNRPLIDNEIIGDSLSVFKKHGSAVAVIPCAEVVFRGKNSSESTVEIPREELWRTQTPHTYTLGKLMWACNQAKAKGLNGMAAMCQLMCRLGEKTFYSRGSEKNLKLTTMDDVDIFKALLNVEKSGWEK